MKYILSNMEPKLPLKYFEDISEFLLALDTLYLLGKIDFNDESQVIEYAKEN